MTAFSDFLEQGLRDHFARDTQLPLEDTWVALYTAAPSDSGGGTEVSGGAYARLRVYQTTSSTPYWTNSTGAGIYGIKNNTALQFSQATSAWGTVVAVGVLDAATAGNLLFHGTLTTSKSISTNDTFEFAVGDLEITFN